MTTYTITVPKANANYVFEKEKLPESSNQAVFEYGLRQLLVDATAQLVRKDFAGTDAEFRIEAKKRADVRATQIRTGTLNMRGGVDPFELMATTLGITVDELKKRLGTADAVVEPKKGKAA